MSSNPLYCTFCTTDACTTMDSHYVIHLEDERLPIITIIRAVMLGAIHGACLNWAIANCSEMDGMVAIQGGQTLHGAKDALQSILDEV